MISVNLVGVAMMDVDLFKDGFTLNNVSFNWNLLVMILRIEDLASSLVGCRWEAMA